MPPVLSTLRYDVEVKGRAPICRVTEVKHEDNHCVFQFGDKHPPCFNRVGDLEKRFKENPEISMVPVTGIGWIEIY